MAGPTCGLMLADMGAEVIKVERFPGGDDTRRTVPPEIEGESAAFMMMNRNKRGIAIDLKKEGGKRALYRLLKEADVLIENFRKGYNFAWSARFGPPSDSSLPSLTNPRRLAQYRGG